MVWLISIGIIIALYFCITWLYNRYKEDVLGIDKQLAYMQKKVSELERKNNMNEQLIDWLYTTLQKKAILTMEDVDKHD